MAPPRSDEAPAPPGVAIDLAERPDWLARYLSERQLGLEAGLLWFTALEMAPGYPTSVKAIAAAVFRKTIGKKLKKAWPTVRELMQLASVHSQNTVVAALKRLCRDGWMLREVRNAASRRLAPARPGQAGVGYRLAWPRVDCIGAPLDGGPERCGRPKTKGGLCTIRAGKGTTHRGTGPCWKHGGDRANKQAAEQETAQQPTASAASPAAPAEPSRPSSQTSTGGAFGLGAAITADRPSLQLVERSANAPLVDNPSIQLPLLQPMEGGMLQQLRLNAPTVGAGMHQPLRLNAPTVVTEGTSKELDQGAREETRGSDVLGAELESAPARSSDGTFESIPAKEHSRLTIDQAHQMLDQLTEHMLAYYLSRAAMDLRKAGRAEHTDDELVLAAAAAIARRRSA